MKLFYNVSFPFKRSHLKILKTPDPDSEFGFETLVFTEWNLTVNVESFFIKSLKLAWYLILRTSILFFKRYRNWPEKVKIHYILLLEFI